ncbi:PREDICTED: uncharacterized protein LOC109177693 [Ipomoea nil]|uniref:uncharacterized protein LOC109177693 n=1 Tax=Ipomoea nil TaxID=35883 RepID=UPI000901ACB9|nr:PREDICTED: uncharacterized protein LOC109177693 [Ipomoea nil]
MIMGSLLHDFNSSIIIPRILKIAIMFFFLKKAQSFPPPHLNETTTAPPSISLLLFAHALPMGLFPEGILDFYLDNVSGRFELHLSHSCAAEFETPVWYNATVSGILSYGQISDLSGVAAQELFLWLPVDSIRVDIPSSGLIYFDVGVVNKQFSLSFFETPRVCNFLGNDEEPSWPPGDLVSIEDLGPIIKTESGKVLKQRYQEDAGIAVS